MTRTLLELITEDLRELLDDMVDIYNFPPDVWAEDRQAGRVLLGLCETELKTNRISFKRLARDMKRHDPDTQDRMKFIAGMVDWTI